MSASNTFDRIQKEIKENLQREKELKRGYAEASKAETNDNVSSENSVKNVPVNQNGNPIIETAPNGVRKFTQNPSTNTRGVMQKFIKSRGRLNLNSLKNDLLNSHSESFEPLKITVEKGKPLRKGFVPAEEKMRQELQEFQVREAQLRNERRKSQPDLMAALQLEDENEFESIKEDKTLKPAKSMANLCSNSTDDDDRSSNYSSISGSLKPARSLAELCDVSDDDVEMPGTYSLIMRFENLKQN